MTRLSGFRPGWLLYASPAVGKGLALAGDVTAFELSMEHSHGGSMLRFTCEMPGARLRHASPGAPEPAALDVLMWRALQSWPQPGVADGRRWPPEMAALLALARGHPEEYARLREAEAVLRALGG